MGARGAGAVCAVVVALLSASASAGPTAPSAGTGVRKGARISWVRGVGADRCVGALGLEEDVKARLGYDPFVLPHDILVEGAVVRAPSGYRVELVVRDLEGRIVGTRQLASRDNDCRSLGDAVAVAVTVAIDPDAPGTRPAAVEETPPIPPPPDALPPSSSIPPSVLPRGRASLSAGASAGLVPDVAPVMSLRVRAALGPRWELGLGASFWPESRIDGLGFALSSGSVDGCAIPLRSVRALRWCASVHVGLFHVFVHAPELAPVEVGMFPWVGAETGPSLSIPLLGWLDLEASVAALVPVTRRQALLRGRPDPAWEQSAVGGRAELGLATRF